MAVSKKTKIIGLTGQTGAGKTTVSRAFADAGFAVIDCDQLARDLQQRPEVLQSLAGVFGPAILAGDGTLDRRALAAAAFASPEQTQKLGGVMYPIIPDEINRLIAEFTENGRHLILLDAPTLLESGVDKMCGKKIAVLADEELRLLRILRRDGITEEQARARMKAQHKDSFYSLRCDYVLTNNSTEDALYKQGAELAAALKKRPGRLSQELKTTLIAFLLILGTIGLIGGGYTVAYRALYPRKYSAAVTACAKEFSVDESLVYAVIRCESSFDPAAVSSVGAYGLMQITNDAYDWVHYRLHEEAKDFNEMLDPELNIRCGCALLSLLLDRFGDEKAAVAAYHAGAGSVEGWLADSEYSKDGKTLDKIPFPTTSRYVDNVLQTRKVYRKLYGEP